MFGVIGDPVAHSLSPLLHNTAFRQLGINAVYLPFRVPRGDLAAVPQGVRAARAARLQRHDAAQGSGRDAGDGRDKAVEQTGAANTLILGDGTGTAYNTDYEGVIQSLRANLPAHLRVTDCPLPLAGRSALVLGAGGVARADGLRLHNEGVTVTIANRTLERAQKLAEEVGCKCVDWGARHNVACDILINCTSVGMHPNLDESPGTPRFLKPGMIVFDTVYTPESTMLIKEARRGCDVITGVELFVRQAALQFQLLHRPGGTDGPVPQARQAGASPVADPGRRRAGGRVMTMNAQNGELIFLIGPRGSGKSTMAATAGGTPRLGSGSTPTRNSNAGTAVRSATCSSGREKPAFATRESAVLRDLCPPAGMSSPREAAWCCGRRTASDWAGRGESSG